MGLGGILAGLVELALQIQLHYLHVAHGTMTSAQAAAQSAAGLSSATGSEITRIVDQGDSARVVTREDRTEAGSLTSLRKISPGKE
jgi:hypothetical protein